jgi:hypothetical protein
MLTRRFILGFGMLSPLGIAVSDRRFHAGDFVKVVRIPSWASTNPMLAAHWRLCRNCMGKLCRVLSVGQDGRPEVDVSEYVAASVPQPRKLSRCSISLEARCLVLVRRGEHSEMPEWAL